MRAAGLGAATFFLPCGFTQVVQLMALSSGSPVTGGAMMALFALGTTPGLFAVGMAAASARASATRRPLRVIGVIVIAFAVITGAGVISIGMAIKLFVKSYRVERKMLPRLEKELAPEAVEQRVEESIRSHKFGSFM